MLERSRPPQARVCSKRCDRKARSRKRSSLSTAARARGSMNLVEPRPVAKTAHIGVVIADGHTLVRAGFRALLDAQPDVAVLSEAGNAEEAVAQARRTRPAVLVIDIGLPGLEDTSRALQVMGEAHLAGANVLMLLSAVSDECTLGALRAGVRGFLPKNSEPSELVGSVRALAAGGGVLPPSLARRVMDEVASLPRNDRPKPDALDELTPRELDVVGLVAAGMSNREIAEHLVVSPATAKTHVSRALRKLSLRDRAQLVAVAYESGLVVPRAFRYAGAVAIRAAGARPGQQPRTHPSPAHAQRARPRVQAPVPGRPGRALRGVPGTGETAAA